MNTLPQDLCGLIDCHLTSVDDIFINYCNHGEFRNIKVAAKAGNWRSVLYFLQRYEYQHPTLIGWYIGACQNGDCKLVNLIRMRYDLNTESANLPNTPMREELRLRRWVAKDIKKNWGIRMCDMKWALEYFDDGIPQIILNLSVKNDFKVISDIMAQHFIDNSFNFNFILCWCAILSLLNRVDELHTFIKNVHQLDMTSTELYVKTLLRNINISKTVLTASIRTDNLELFIQFHGSEVDDCVLSDILDFSAHKILKYVFETYNPKTYVHIWEYKYISDPRIARFLANQKELKITGLVKLINSCIIKKFSAVFNILLTLL